MARMTQEKRLSIQLVIACVLIAVGLGLLIAGFIVAPCGVIDNTVLVAFGETCTFAGALIGVDYHYGYKRFTDDRDRRDRHRDCHRHRDECDCDDETRID